MSIVFASNLSSSDLRRLGNNLGPRQKTGLRRRRRMVQAVNRSLAGLGEKVQSLHRPTFGG